jgi:maltooligosyltrehalose trehalohydrolase
MTNTFRVWAPRAKRVEVQIGEKRLPMSAATNGWWGREALLGEKYTDYGFVIDGEGPFPDPRSGWQSHGVHGGSRLLDHGAFQWADEGWQPPPLSSAVIYELHVGTFTSRGTFESAIEKLDHLATLGVTHVELMPVVEFAGRRGWGYDGVDFFAPHHIYGGPEGLKFLVEACHARKLAVLLDVVYNHAGPSGNYLARFGPYFSTFHSGPWGPAFNFDGTDSNEVRRFFCDNALMWLRDYHIDGLRIDAVHAIFDGSAVPFLEQLAVEVRQLEAQLGRRLVLIPESDLNDPRLLWSRERGGFGLDAQWSDDFHHALHAVLTGERSGYYADFGTLGDLCRALRDGYVYTGQYSAHRRRRHGRKPDYLNGHHFLAYLQNHDQIGNRAKGERSASLMRVGLLKIGAALVFTSPFVPMLFQGEEWGAMTPFLYFTNYEEPELAHAVREGRCRESAAFGWKPEELPDPQDHATFERSKLDWFELLHRPHQEVLAWHQRLIRLRCEEPTLTNGDRESLRTHYDEENRWLVMERDSISVVCNFAGHAQSIPLRPGKHRVLLSSGPMEKFISDAAILSPESVVILKLTEETDSAG